MNDKKQIENKKQLISILRNSKDIVVYQPNAREIPIWSSDKRKFFIQDDNGHLTIRFNKIVDEIYTQGYRKIPEGSVVISKEEYNGYDKLISQYKNLEINYNNMYENYREYALENETLKQELVILQTECKQARKQAVKEVLGRVKKLYTQTTPVEEATGYTRIDELLEVINEIAKEFGVEL